MRVGIAAFSAFGVSAAMLVGACGGDTIKSQQGNALTIRATDYRFDVSGDTKAGVTTINFVNNGKEPHVLVMAKLKPGKAPSDLLPLLQGKDKPDEQAAAQVLDEPLDSFHGQPGFTLPGDSIRTITKELTPGTYAIVCPMRTPQHEIHAAKGMVAELVVQPGDASRGSVQIDGEIAIEDGSFKLPTNLKDGTYRVVNNGKEPHDVTVGQFVGNANIDDVDKVFNDYFAAASGDPGSPPASVPTFPAHVVGSFSDTLPPGAVGYLVLKDLKSGRYTVASESDDNNRTRFHTEFTVK